MPVIWLVKTGSHDLSWTHFRRYAEDFPNMARPLSEGRPTATRTCTDRNLIPDRYRTGPEPDPKFFRCRTNRYRTDAGPTETRTISEGFPTRLRRLPEPLSEDCPNGTDRRFRSFTDDLATRTRRLKEEEKEVPQSGLEPRGLQFETQYPTMRPPTHLMKEDGKLVIVILSRSQSLSGT